MSLFGLSKSNRSLYRKFFEKTGIEITDEPISRLPPEIDDDMNDIYHDVFRKARKAIPRLEKYMERYPHIDTIKNYLYIAYTLAGKEAKADAMLDRMMEEHPDYIFGYTSKILKITDKEELEKYAPLLGNPRDVRSAWKEDGPIHISAFVSYQAAAAYYEANIGEWESAYERLDGLIELKVEKAKIDNVVEQLARVRSFEMAERMKNLTDRGIEVEAIPKITEERTEAPNFENDLVQLLYERDVNFSHRAGDKPLSEAEIGQFMELPRESFIRDLEKVLEDAIYRFNYFTNEAEEEEGYAPIHALFFLGTLKVEASLPKVIDLLRIGADFSEVWFGDMQSDFIFPTLYNLSENQLEVLKKYVLEEYNSPYDRMLASKVVMQVALHQPERRKEALKWFEEVFSYLLETEKEGLIDSSFISFSVSYLTEMRATELWSLIEELYQKGWILNNIQGNLEKIEEQINRPQHPYYIEPLPENIYEYYSWEYLERADKTSPFAEEAQKEMDEILNPTSKGRQRVEQYAMRSMISAMSGGAIPIIPESETADDGYHDYEELAYTPRTTGTVVRSEPKVGRNDPCPCGSGKKYKKCCLRK